MPSSLEFPFGFHDQYLKSGIYRDLKKFYEAYENKFQGHLLKHKNEQDNVIEVFKDIYFKDEDSFRTLKFEDTIKLKIISEINRTIEYIKQSCAQYIVAEDKSLRGYYKYLVTKCEDLFKMKAFIDFLFLDSYYKRIKDTITSIEIDIEGKSTITKSLIVKEKYSPKFFNELYDIATDEKYGIVIYHSITQPDFVNLFIYPDSDKKLKFSVKNGIAVAFLEAIRPIFLKYNAKIVEQSDKFRTNDRNINFKQSNYNKSKGDINEDDLKLIKELKTKIVKLINQY